MSAAVTAPERPGATGEPGTCVGKPTDSDRLLVSWRTADDEDAEPGPISQFFTAFGSPSRTGKWAEGRSSSSVREPTLTFHTTARKS